jgi:hypothetical protein
MASSGTQAANTSPRSTSGRIQLWDFQDSAAACSGEGSITPTQCIDIMYITALWCIECIIYLRICICIHNIYISIFFTIMHAHLWNVSAFHFQVLHGPGAFARRSRRLWHGAKLKRQETAAQTFWGPHHVWVSRLVIGMMWWYVIRMLQTCQCFCHISMKPPGTKVYWNPACM